MSLDEATAYALVTWARFDEAVTDDLLRAVCGAFAIVAAADGDVAETEISGFLDVIREKSDAFPQLDMVAVEQLFRDLSMAVLTDPEGGRQHVLAEIARVKDMPKQRELVRTAAQVAIFADRRVEGREQEVMKEICAALGVSMNR
ncbi:MAG: TerB family tellurite resistance protein [Candidatus Binatia bacterium]